MSTATVVDLDDWRDPDGVLKGLPAPRAPLRRGWHDLGWIGVSDRRDAIRVYRRQGLHAILLHGVEADGSCTCGRGDCAAVGKHPVRPGWQRAPFDFDALDRALMERWRFNVGLRMGPQPGGFTLIAIDVDGPLTLLEPIEREHGTKFPPTLTAKTARGFHLLYKVPVDVEVRNRVRLAPGVDVRATGGQIVAPPSLHVSGHNYEWIDAREPEVLP